MGGGGVVLSGAEGEEGLRLRVAVLTQSLASCAAFGRTGAPYPRAETASILKNRSPLLPITQA